MVSPVYPYYGPATLPAKPKPRRKPPHDQAGAQPTFQQTAQQEHVTEKSKPQSAVSQPLPQPPQSTQKSQVGHKITLQDILTDVDNTVDALNVTEPTQKSVTLYLKAITHQAQTKAPSKPFIQESLKAIGKELDGFIGDTLKQPSRVVADWVDALLLQPIDYRLDKTPSAKPKAKSANVVPNKSEAVHIGEIIQQAKDLADQGKFDTSIQLLQQALGKSAHPAEQNQLSYWLGRVLEKSGKPGDAATYYETLLGKTEGLSTAQQFRIATALAHHWENTGQPDKALTAYSSATSAGKTLANKATDEKSTRLANQLAQLHNDWASTHLHQHPNEGEKALEHLKTARRWAIAGDKTLLPDIYANMATVWGQLDQPENRSQAYLKGLNAAKKLGNQSTYLNLLAKYQAS